MSIDIENELDNVDYKILGYLEDEGRITMSELAKRVGMSAPSVVDRVRRLENRGVIRRFTVDLDLSAMGFAMEAIVRIKPRPGNLHIVERMIIDQPRFVSCDGVTGDDCFVARLVLKKISELDDLLGPFHERAETSTAIIKSSPIKARSPLS